MRQLTYLNIALLALFVTMALVLGVVCLIYLFYIADDPRLRAELSYLLISTSWFFALAIVSAAATYWLVKRRRGLWLMQGTLAATIAGMVLFYWPK